MSIPKQGDMFRANPTALIASNRGIQPGSVWVVSCTTGDRISLEQYAGNGSGWSHITVLKSIFGANFNWERQRQESTAYLRSSHGRSGVTAETPIQPV